MRWVAPSEKDTANETLEKRLWAAADQFRANSGLKAGQYSTPVLGLIFLRFAEARFAKRRAELEKAGGSARRGMSRIDDPKAYMAEGVLFLTPSARFDYLLQRPEGSNVGRAVNEAMADIEKHNPQLGGVLPRNYQIFNGTLLKELLKQTIARANRVFPGKHSGMIVDYANVFASLERALAIYTQGRGGNLPVRDKKALVDELRQTVADATAYCKARGVDVAKIEGTSAEKFERAQAVEDGANRLLAPEAVKRDFLARARLVDALYGAVKPDPVAVEFATRCGSIRALADYIRNRSDPPDISHILQGIQELLDKSIGAEPFKIKGAGRTYGAIDLSKIDFEALAKRFEKQKPTSSDLERLKAAVRAQLERMVRFNPTRADYLEKFRELIDAYNSGSRNIAEIFRDLLALTGVLTEEQERHVREHLSEEELTIFDILTRPGPTLTTEERDEVKKVARQLLERLNALLVLGWRQKAQARAGVRLAIEDGLDEGLPRAYTKETYQTKCNALFEHVYESYMGDGKSSYTEAA